MQSPDLAQVCSLNRVAHIPAIPLDGNQVLGQAYLSEQLLHLDSLLGDHASQACTHTLHFYLKAKKSAQLLNHL